MKHTIANFPVMGRLWPFALSILLILGACMNGTKSAESSSPSPVLRISTEGRKAQCLSSTKDLQGIPWLSWAEKDSLGTPLFFAAPWDNSKGKFSEPIAIPLEPGTALHHEGMPRLAFDGTGTLFLLYETHTPSPAHRFGIRDLRYRYSLDKGSSWTSPRSLGEKARPDDSRSFAQIRRLADGEMGVCWLDTDPSEEGGRPLYFARTQGNRTFSAPLRVKTPVCPCCRTALSVTSEGEILLAFRDLNAGSQRDISLAWSGNGGKSFQVQPAISGDQWKLDGCPHNGPVLASGKSRTWMSWYTGGSPAGLHIGRLGPDHELDLKILLSPEGRFSDIALTEKEDPLIAYDEQYTKEGTPYRRILLTRLEGEQQHTVEVSLPLVSAGWPTVENWGPSSALVAWIQDDQVCYRIIPYPESGRE